MLQWFAFQRPIALRHTRIVHQYVDPTKSPQHRFHQALCRRLVREVLLDGQYSLAAGIYFPRTFVDAWCCRCDRHPRTRGVEAPCDGKSYPLGVIDVWFTEQVRPRLRGPSTLIRFCDDFVMLFAHRADADRVLAVLGKRLGKFGLQLHPDKTRLVDFRPVRDPASGADEMLPTTFAFLGFTHVWGASRRGYRVVRQFTAKDRLARSLKAFNQQCRRMLHWPLAAQHERLCRMLKGHYGYFGITGNLRRLALLHHEVRRLWRRWLSRRSSKSSVTWERFDRVLERLALPPPRIVHRYTVA